MPPAAHYENIVTIVATATMVLGLYAMGAGLNALCAFVLLLNINTPEKPR